MSIEIYSAIHKIVNETNVVYEDGTQLLNEIAVNPVAPATNMNKQKSQSQKDAERKRDAWLAAQKKVAQEQIKQIDQALKEDHLPDEFYRMEDESEMLKSQLCQAHEAASRLMKLMGDGTNFPEWFNAKITLATDYLITCESYLNSKHQQYKDQRTSVMQKRQGTPMMGFSFDDGRERTEYTDEY